MKAKKLISLLIAGAMTLSLVPSTGMVALAEEQVQETVGATPMPTQEAVEPTPTQEVADATPAPTQKAADITDVFEVSNQRAKMLSSVLREQIPVVDLAEGSITITSTQIEQVGKEPIPYTGGKVRITQSNSDTPTGNLITVGSGISGVELILDGVNCIKPSSYYYCIDSSSEVTLTLEGENKVADVYATKKLTINGDGALEVTSYIYSFDTIEINSGTVKAGNSNINMGIQTINLKINGGNVTATADRNSGAAIRAAGNVEINGGTVTVDGYDDIYAKNNVTINGGTVDVKYRGISAGNLIINGGTVVGNIRNYAGNLIINGGTVTV